MQSKKLHFGPLKSDKPFLTVHQTMPAADAAFYKGYDPLLLAKKATALYGVYKHIEAFWSCSESWDVRLESKEDLLSVIATELHSSTFHQTEAMIALLLCEYQNRPDWVYLTSYSNAEVKRAVKAIAAGDFGSITESTATSPEAFVKTAVFATWDLSQSDNLEAWERSVSDIAWLLGHVAERFVGGHEYNAYKHGVRVVCGSAVLAVSPSGTDSFRPIVTMPHSVTYLELNEQPEGYAGSRVTKEINPEYSFELIHCMASVLRLSREMRLARINRRLDTVDLPEIDRRGLVRLRPSSNYSFPY